LLPNQINMWFVLCKIFTQSREGFRWNGPPGSKIFDLGWCTDHASIKPHRDQAMAKKAAAHTTCKSTC
jgi:hypothetical protein